MSTWIPSSTHRPLKEPRSMQAARPPPPTLDPSILQRHIQDTSNGQLLATDRTPGRHSPSLATLSNIEPHLMSQRQAKVNLFSSNFSSSALRFPVQLPFMSIDSRWSTAESPRGAVEHVALAVSRYVVLLHAPAFSLARTTD